MIEHVIKNYLEKNLSVPVFFERRPDQPARMILVERVGGSETALLSRPRIAIQSYEESLEKAALLNESVKTALRKLSELPQVCSIKLSTDYNFTDTTSKAYRYQAVFEITHYKEE